MSKTDNSCTTCTAAPIEGLNKEPVAASNPLCHVSPGIHSGSGSFL